MNVHETKVFYFKFENQDVVAKVSADELDRSPLIVFLNVNMNVRKTQVFYLKFENPDLFAKVSADELDRSPLIVFALGAILPRNSLRVSDDGLGLRNLQ